MLLLFLYPTKINIEDEHLKKTILKQLKKTNDKINILEIKKIKKLDLKNANITNLKGLEYFYNLEELDLASNKITDVRPLLKLKKLKKLSLYNNEILDLEKINLSKLKNIKTLKELDLGHNVIKYKDDTIKESRLENIEPLCQITQLEKIKLRDNYIKNINCLKNLPNLKKLNINENLIESKDLEILKNHKLLTNLSLFGIGKIDLKHISKLNHLKKLNLSNNELSNIKKIENLTKIEYLNLSMTNFDFTKINYKNLEKLKTLILTNNSLENIDFLKNFKNLKELNLKYNNIKDISPLQDLKLTVLNLQNNKIEDFKPLLKNKKITSLFIQSNPIKDFSIFKPIFDQLLIKDFDLYIYSGVPKIYINTNNISIKSKENRIMASMQIKNGNSNYPEAGLYKGIIGIRGRGNSSWTLPKKPYNIELWDKYKNPIDAQILDMFPEEDWVLIANYSDKTLLRNYLSNYLSNALELHWTPKTRFVELYLNNNYQGLYQLTERIKRDENRLALNKIGASLKDQSKPNITGGYILRSDRIKDKDYFITKQAKKTLLYQYPKNNKITPNQKNYIQKYINDFENSLYIKDIKNNNNYTKYIDIESFINYFLIVEFSRDVDAVGLSEYMYKNKLGKLKMGPVWDFDIAYGNADYREGWKYNGWSNLTIDNRSWYKQLLKNDKFYKKLIKRWEEVKHHFYKLEEIIDEQSTKMEVEIKRNFEKWDILGKKVWPNPEPIPKDYNEEIQYLKNWIKNRIKWFENELKNIRNHI